MTAQRMYYAVTPHPAVPPAADAVLEEAVLQAIRLYRIGHPKMAGVALSAGLVLAEAEAR